MPFRHGDYKTRLYRIWADMKSRCYYEKNNHYDTYGGRGITVCDEWKNDFVLFRNWALANGYSDELTLDRKDNNIGYTPDNCRWVTRAAQAHNLRAGSRSKCGVAGIDQLPNGKFRATITVNYKKLHIGVYDLLEDAANARRNAEREYWGCSA